MNRDTRKKIAQHTITCFNKGYYTYNSLNNSSPIPIQKLHKKAEENIDLIIEESPKTQYNVSNKKYSNPASISVVNEPVPDVFIKRQAHSYGVLNFASAYHPGGGFLNGSIAQEESLCYGSNLYLLQVKYLNEFYNYNKKQPSKCYSDRMIYTPYTVFIKDSSYHLLPHPILANILTCPAVNLRAATNNGESENKCYDVMKKRMRKILSVFVNEGNDRIILGAFGCGVFGNDSKIIACIWNELLNDEGWKYQFKEIIFAVYDRGESMYKIFDENIQR